MPIKILLADDHEFFVKRMQHLLDKQPNIKVVGVALDGEKAVKLAQELLPDLVLMDISMPEMNGIAATRKITKSMPQTKVLCLTVHAEQRFVSAMFRAGALGYMLKDCSIKELTQAIQDVYSGRRYVGRQVASYFKDIDL